MSIRFSQSFCSITNHTTTTLTTSSSITTPTTSHDNLPHISQNASHVHRRRQRQASVHAEEADGGGQGDQVGAPGTVFAGRQVVAPAGDAEAAVQPAAAVQVDETSIAQRSGAVQSRVDVDDRRHCLRPIYRRAKRDDDYSRLNKQSLTSEARIPHSLRQRLYSTFCRCTKEETIQGV